MTDPAAARRFAQNLLPAKLPEPRTAQAYAPSNIALAKYWGKRDASLNLPLNSSLSISLADWGSTTHVAPSETNEDEVVFEGITLSQHDSFARKIIQHVDLFRGGHSMPLRIETSNTIPTAAGLASSASGFAALTVALDRVFGLNLTAQQLSRLARLGSGSASRSIWHGFVRWNKGEAGDGLDSHGAPLNITWPEFRIAIVPVDTAPKSQTSRDGMNHTVATSPLYASWPETAEQDCDAIQSAVLAQDFDRLGALAEANALTMHATMLAARPSLAYLKPASWNVLEMLWKARADGLEAYATMDAGANVKLLFLEDTATDIASFFPQAQIIDPFSAAA